MRHIRDGRGTDVPDVINTQLKGNNPAPSQKRIVSLAACLHQGGAWQLRRAAQRGAAGAGERTHGERTQAGRAPAADRSSDAAA